MKDEGKSKGNIIMVTDGPSIPNPREWRLINAWSIALCGAIITLVLGRRSTVMPSSSCLTACCSPSR